MGLRFRKSIKLGGGTRLNLSKSGVGFSFGTKGARITKKAGGGTRTTISAPGTGLSYVQESGKPKRAGNSRGNSRSSLNSNGPQKRNTWLWVIGWLLIFPVPLTIIMLRKKEMKPAIKYGIILAGWVLYFLIALLGGSGSSSENISRNQIGGNITEITFANTDDVTLKSGETNSSGQVRVKVKKMNEFSPENVEFISENPDIAMIKYTKSALTTTLYYDITAKSAGETTVFVASSDGSVLSEKIKVIVLKPVEVESISLSATSANVVLGEHMQVTVDVRPKNADHKEIKWTSSNEAVATVDQNGNIVAVGGGLSTITAKASNEIAESFELAVDGTKRLMSLQVTHSREDDNNIGDEWSYNFQVNGESAGREYIISAGDKLSFYAEITESDDNPDVGKASKTYTVKEEDLINGFIIAMDLYVKENGGKNRGKSAHFTVTYHFAGEK